MPLYYAQAICSIFGRKHALLLCPSNLQLFWTQTSPTTMSIEFSVFLDANIHAICSFLDANMPYYPAHAIYSFFGRKHALLRCLYNLQLFWTQTCTITMPMQFAAFLDANMPLYYGHAICSFFGRKYALILWPCNLQLFWTHRYAENTKILEK